jgi:hypothetical protein
MSFILLEVCAEPVDLFKHVVNVVLGGGLRRNATDIIRILVEINTQKVSIKTH